VDKSQPCQKYDIAPDVIIAVGPVSIPQYQDRPQIVTQDKDGLLEFAQFDRWGEGLNIGMSRVITENLVRMLPGASIEMFPVNYAIPVKYQVIVDVVGLESELGKDAYLVAQWSIIDSKNKKMVFTKRSEFLQPITPPDYVGLSNVLSAACVSLSGEIAEELVALEKQ
jgi:hypothetical protein